MDNKFARKKAKKQLKTTPWNKKSTQKISTAVFQCHG